MFLSAALLLAPLAQAGERNFAFSYGYGTLPQGGIEAEAYLTGKQAEGGADSFEWEPQVELEYGITDHLEGALYLVTSATDSGPLTFSGYKARLRYRFGSEGVGAVDPAIYLEYIGSPNFQSHGLEAKLILGKTVERFESALNLEYKIGFEGEEIGHEIEPTLGLGYRVKPWVTLGVEAMGEVEFEEGEMGGPFVWAGPTVHLAGKGGRLWWTLSGIVGLTEASREDHQVIVRSLVGLNL